MHQFEYRLVKGTMENILWKIVYKGFEPEQEGLRETICALGNGYLCTRGAAVEAIPSEIHYPGTYIAGVYNRLPTHIAGRTILNEDLINCPNWMYLTFRIGDWEWFCPSSAKILFYQQELDMKQGFLYKKIRFQTHKGFRTRIEEKRIVNMAEPHLVALKYSITPENYSNSITVRTMLDGAMLNMNVERYRQLSFTHWQPYNLGRFGEDGIYLCKKTSSSDIGVCEAAKLRIVCGNKQKNISIEVLKHGKAVIGQEFRIFVEKGKTYDIEKIAAIYTTQDAGIKNPKTAAIKHLKNSKWFNQSLNIHIKAWAQLWDKIDLYIQGDAFSQKILRLHIFHLLQTASKHNVKIDAGFPARGLHGEAYRGHIFWDEIFAMHFFDFNLPDTAKALLMYRYRRLAQAREYAKVNGYKGSMFPWQSGSEGTEETQQIHLNPLSGKWGADHSCLQRHISFAIAYNVWRYYIISGDIEFLINYGAELLFSIAHFGASLTYYSNKDKRYHTKGLMGPDEFHEKLPNAESAGLQDNTYTNFMIVLTLLYAEKMLKIIPEKNKIRLLKKLGIDQAELKFWHKITYRMKIIINEQGIISQFAGYFKLQELDWAYYRKKYKNIHRLDRILKAEGKSPDAYKVAKQADVLMIFYLLPLSEVADILSNLGYKWNKNLLRKNYNYYVKRTSHGSTLSKVVHCYIAHILRKKKEAWDWYREVLESDIYDTQGGTTPEGIHTGVMGGSIDIALRAFAGVEITDDYLKITPKLPECWNKMKFQLCYKGKLINFKLSKSVLNIYISQNNAESFAIKFKINSSFFTIKTNESFKFSL
ncbi:MAG: glycoside hydrolase family 65 protein [Candidatus Omnitrophota bacterium]|nr:MAG: glycoside hydrolase family 65 protein [Candidatus Omnitrophota bacterium]